MSHSYRCHIDILNRQHNLTSVTCTTKYTGAATCCSCLRSFWYGFYEYCVYLLHSLQFLAVRGRCPPAAHSNESARRVCGHPVLLLPSPTSHSDVGCDLSAPVHSCHMTFPLWATAAISFVLVLCLFQHSSPRHCRQQAVFFVLFSADNFGANSFPSLSVTMFEPANCISGNDCCRSNGVARHYFAYSR